MRHTLSIVFGACFTASVCWALGCLIFRALRIQLARLERDLLAFIIGGAVLSIVIFAMSVAHLVYTPALLTIGLLTLATRWFFRDLSARPVLPPLTLTCRLLFLIPFAFYALVYFSNSMAPEISPDGSTYHLGLVYRYYRMHGFDRGYVTFFGSLSQGMEMLYLFAFSFGRQSAAATLHLFSFLALAGMLLCLGRRAGKPEVGIIASLLVYLSPLAGIDAVSAYNDVALAAAGFAVFYLVEIWDEDRSDALLIPIGLAAGFCFAIKYTGAVVILYAAIAVIRKHRLRLLLPLGLAAALAAVPWVARNWMSYGNPVSPLFNRYFPNPYFHINTEESLRAYFRTYELRSFRSLPWILTVGGDLGGQIGPLFLAFPLALTALWTRPGRRSLLAAIILMLPYPSNISARFLIPALPFLALAIAEGFHILIGRFPRPAVLTAQVAVVTAAGVLAWPRVIDRYRAPAVGWQIVDIPWQVALGLIPADGWLLKHSDGWVVARMLDTFVPAGERVWSSAPVSEGYTKTDVRVSWQSADAEVVQDILYAATRSAFRWTFSFPARPVSKIRLRQTGTASDQWSVAEVNFSGGGKVMKPRAFHASINGWDAALALDNNPVTRWRTWQAMRPGQFIAAEFNTPVSLDRVKVDMPADPRQNHVEIEGIAAIPTIEEIAAGSGARLQAARAIRARGYSWLLIADDHFSAADVRPNPARWGLRLVAGRGAAKLYRIE